MGRLRFAMVCASNQNRSLEAHALLSSKGFDVQSYGTSSKVKLPGPSATEPNVFPFNTPYQQMHSDLLQRDPQLYTRNGVLAMLQRNMHVKAAPERWQDCRLVFDVALTFEERVLHSLIADMHERGPRLMLPCLVINLETVDNHTEASAAAPHALRLCELLEAAGEWETDLDAILKQFESETGRQPGFDVEYY